MTLPRRIILLASFLLLAAIALYPPVRLADAPRPMGRGFLFSTNPYKKTRDTRLQDGQGGHEYVPVSYNVEVAEGRLVCEILLLAAATGVGITLPPLRLKRGRQRLDGPHTVADKLDQSGAFETVDFPGREAPSRDT